MHLRNLQKTIQSTSNYQGVYEKILQVPHFLELVLEVVITQFVKAENERWGTDSQTARLAEKEFLKFLEKKLSPILTILADAKSQVDAFLASERSTQ